MEGIIQIKKARYYNFFCNENCNARTRPGARDTGATVSVWHIIGLKANASQEAEKQSSFHP